MNFVVSAANVFAFIVGVPMNRDVNAVRKIADGIMVPKFKPKEMKVETTNANIEIKAQDDDDKVAEMLVQMSQQQPKVKSLKIVEFEKDDDSNYHIDFMSNTANLRARNYKIQEADRFKIKMIAGKIIPAVATATAMVVGAVGLEFIKIALVL